VCFEFLVNEHGELKGFLSEEFNLQNTELDGFVIITK
jgi:hypothetical protein